MIITTASSIYYVDEKNKLIWGGKFGAKQYRYISYEPIVMGERAIFHLKDGRMLRTSLVKKVVAH